MKKEFITVLGLVVILIGSVLMINEGLHTMDSLEFLSGALLVVASSISLFECITGVEILDDSEEEVY